MGQFIMIIILGIILKLVSDIFREKFPKNGGAKPKGAVIDVSNAWIDMSKMPFQKRTRLLSENELAIYKMIKQILTASDYEVFPKVGFGELFLLAPGVVHNPQEYLKRIRQKSADWVICERLSLQPALVILETGHPEDRNSRIDAFSKEALQAAGLPYMAVNPGQLPAEAEFRQAMRQAGLNV